MAAAGESRRLRRASRGRDEAEEEGRRTADDQEEGLEDEEATSQEDSGGKDSGGGVFSELKDVVSEAALGVLAPVAKEATTKAAEVAMKKGPELFEQKVLPKLDEAGGPMGLVQGLTGDGNPVGNLLSKVTGGDDDGGGKEAGDGTGKGRRMPIQQSVDVAAPIDVVYDQFTQFEDWPKFMHRLESVSQKDDATVEFNEKIWIVRRKWEAEIVEQRPDERIVWESVSGIQHVGVVTFHELAERLTRIELNIDIDPSGPMEKIARGARFAKRAVRADLHRFKAYIEMQEEETGAWRGEIQEGEVVDDGSEDERYEDEPEAEYEDEEPEAESEEEEPEAEYEEEEPEEEEQEEEQEEPEEEPAQARQSRSRSRSRGSSNGSSKSESAKPRRSSSKKSSSSSKSRSRGSSGSGSSSKSKAKSGSSSGSRSRSGGSGSRSGGSGSRSGGSGSKSRSKSSSSKS